MGMGVFQQKEPKMPGALKIGAAISGLRIAGGKITDMRFFLTYNWGIRASTSTVAALFSRKALTGQRIAMVDMVLLVFPAFPYLP